MRRGAVSLPRLGAADTILAADDAIRDKKAATRDASGVWKVEEALPWAAGETRCQNLELLYAGGAISREGGGVLPASGRRNRGRHSIAVCLGMGRSVNTTVSHVHT